MYARTKKWAMKLAKVLTQTIIEEWNFGVGTGATVGKFRGMDYCMKSGIGATLFKLVS